MLGTQHAPGNEYGKPRDLGIRTPFSQFLFQLFMNAQKDEQPLACVEAHDDKGNSTGAHVS